MARSARSSARKSASSLRSGSRIAEATSPLLLSAASVCLLLTVGAVPSDVHAKTLDRLVDDAVWEGLQGCKDIDGTRKYLRDHPEGEHAAEAEECITWDTAKRCEKRELVLKFLETYPNSSKRGEAEICLDRLDSLRRLKVQVERLLSECRAHHKANRLTAGSGGNALDCYARVLKMDPGNAKALDGIARIERYYVDKAVSSLERERPERVERWIERLSSINPEHPQIEVLTAKFAELRQLLAEHERQAAAREELRREVEALLAAGKPEAARSRLREGRKEGLTVKAMAALEERVERALAQAEVARSLSRMVAEIRSLIEQGEVERARKRLGEARALGLDDGTHGKLAAAIGEAEARREVEARAAEVKRRLEICDGEYSERRVAAALGCYREVLAVEPDHAVAASKVRSLAALEAYIEAKDQDTVEAYFAFEQAHPGTALAGTARFRLRKMEEGYWKTVQETGTRAAYKRYRRIYPDGRFTEQADTWLKRGE